MAGVWNTTLYDIFSTSNGLQWTDEIDLSTLRYFAIVLSLQEICNMK